MSVNTSVLPITGPAHPWRKTLRTVIQGALSLATVSPLIYSVVTNGANPGEATGVMAAILADLAIITRLFNTPAVEQVLKTYVPWLAASDIERETASKLIRDVASQSVVVVGEDGDPVAGPASHLMNGTPVVVKSAAPRHALLEPPATG